MEGIYATASPIFREVKLLFFKKSLILVASSDFEEGSSDFLVKWTHAPSAHLQMLPDPIFLLCD